MRYGVSDPISVTAPSEDEKKKSLTLDAFMHERNLYETPEGHKQRKKALEALYGLLNNWVRASAISQGMSAHELDPGRDLGCRLHTFGSYKLGVVGPEGDIDICIVNSNSYVTRGGFFSTFTEILKNDPRTERLVKVPEAYTPIVKFKFMGIEMDLLFATVSPQSRTLVVNDNIVNNEILDGADDATVRCLNGIRVNQKILDLVPNIENFKGGLRLIKEWANTRGLYSNVLGYFGGITWAILLAQVCQLYPLAPPSTVVCKFFKIYSQWNWGKPVVLCPLESSNTPSLRHLHVWSPKDPSSRAHLMPILTPAFPSMNSTHNVSKTTKKIILKEIQRGHSVCQSIEASDPDQSYPLWQRLLEPCDLFMEYENFLFIEAYACDEECFKDYTGFIESKLRLLVKRLEMTPGIEFRPWPEALNFTPSEEIYRPEGLAGLGYPFGQARIIAFDVIDAMGDDEMGEGGHVDFREAVSQWEELIRGWIPNKSAYADMVNLRICHRSRENLPSYCRDSVIVKAKKDLSPP